MAPINKPLSDETTAPVTDSFNKNIANPGTIMNNGVTKGISLDIRFEFNLSNLIRLTPVFFSS